MKMFGGLKQERPEKGKWKKVSKSRMFHGTKEMKGLKNTRSEGKSKYKI